MEHVEEGGGNRVARQYPGLARGMFATLWLEWETIYRLLD